MNALLSLSIMIGTNINFGMWCILALGITFMIFYHFSNNFQQKVQDILKKYRISKRRRLFFDIAGHQGLPIQLEIFEQNLGGRIRSLKEQLFNFFKIPR